MPVPGASKAEPPPDSRFATGRSTYKRHARVESAVRRSGSRASFCASAIAFGGRQRLRCEIAHASVFKLRVVAVEAHLGRSSLGPIVVAGAGGIARAGVGGQLEINVVDYETGQPLACRIHLTNQAGKVQKPPKVPFWHDHFIIDGSLTLKLPSGNFNFVVERGPEYLVVTGHFEIHDFAEDSKTITLRRFVDMSREGWWSGDLEVERPKKEIELLMRADDLHVAELVTWGNLKDLIKPAPAAKPPAAKTPAQSRRPAGDARPQAPGHSSRLPTIAATTRWPDSVRRPGGSLLVLGLDTAPPEETIAHDTAAELVAWAREQGTAWIDVRRATSWDLPIWIALGMVDSIELADSQLARGSVKPDEAGTRPRERGQVSGPRRCRPLDRDGLLQPAQLRTADSAYRCQRLGGGAQSGRLQPPLCPRRPAIQLRAVAGEFACRPGGGDQRSADSAQCRRRAAGLCLQGRCRSGGGAGGRIDAVDPRSGLVFGDRPERPERAGGAVGSVDRRPGESCRRSNSATAAGLWCER